MKKSQASIPDISWTFRRPELNAALEREAGWGSPICLPSSLPVWEWECWAHCPHTVFLMTLLLLHIKTECLERKHLCNRNESSNNPKSKCYSTSKDESQNTKLDFRDKKHMKKKERIRRKTEGGKKGKMDCELWKWNQLGCSDCQPCNACINPVIKSYSSNTQKCHL